MDCNPRMSNIRITTDQNMIIKFIFNQVKKWIYAPVSMPCKMPFVTLQEKHKVVFIVKDITVVKLYFVCQIYFIHFQENLKNIGLCLLDLKVCPEGCKFYYHVY